jgi:hypothetical protein
MFRQLPSSGYFYYGGVPDDEISLSVLLHSVHGCSIFVVLGLSFMVAVGMVSWAGVGDHQWKQDALLETSVCRAVRSVDSLVGSGDALGAFPGAVGVVLVCPYGVLCG